MKKEVPTNIVTFWGETHQKAFQHIKDSLCEHTKLAHPDYGIDAEPLCVTCDASEIGCGFMLSQVVKRKKGDKMVRLDRPIMFGANRFSTTESRLPSSVRELIGLWYALRKLAPYILNMNFFVKCDCSALLYIKSGWKQNYGKLHRVITFLDSFGNFPMHIPGKSPKIRWQIHSRLSNDLGVGQK